MTAMAHEIENILPFIAASPQKFPVHILPGGQQCIVSDAAPLTVPEFYKDDA
jgi:hypothetical protein